MSTTSTARNGSPPGAATRFLVALVVLAAAGLAWDLRGVEATSASMAAVAVLVVLGTVSLVRPLLFHHGGSVSGFTLAPAVLFTLAMLTEDALAVVLLTAVAAVGYGLATRSAFKTAFNASQSALAALVALLIAQSIVGGDLSGDALEPRVALAIGVGTVVLGLVNMTLVMEMLHRHAGEGRLALTRELLVPTLWLAAGDWMVALLLSVLASRSAAAILLAVPMFMGVQLSYRGLAAERAGQRRAELLHGTSRQLLESALDDAAFDRAVDSLRALFDADHVALVVADGHVPDWMVEVAGAVWSTGRAVRTGPEPTALAVPVRSDGEVVGVLAVGGHRGTAPWGPGDLDLLATVAGEVAATLRTRRLLGDLEQERARLAAETGKLNDVLASATDGIVVVDHEGRITACNPAMTAMLGAGSTPLGCHWTRALSLESEDGRPLDQAPEHPLAVALEGHSRVQAATATLRRVDGSVRWLRCSAAPVLSQAGPDGVVLVVVDVTTEHEVEQLRNDFIATVSHELRTPLTPLRGFLRVLGEHGTSVEPDRMQVMVSAMERQVGRLADLIGDLLHVAEVGRGTAPLEIQRVRLADAVADVIAVEAVAADERGRVVDAVPDVEAFADRDALRRILRGLVSNGLKHTTGTVVLSARRNGDRVVLTCRDEGPAIPATEREVVFAPFRRLGDHLQRPQGPGLGLSVARSLAQNLDGSLTLAPSDGSGGNTFVLELPAAVPLEGTSHIERDVGVSGH